VRSGINSCKNINFQIKQAEDYAKIILYKRARATGEKERERGREREEEEK